MLCVYYRKDEEVDYLNSVIVGYDATKVIQTSYVDKVKDLLEHNHFIRSKRMR